MKGKSCWYSTVYKRRAFKITTKKKNIIEGNVNFRADSPKQNKQYRKNKTNETNMQQHEENKEGNP